METLTPFDAVCYMNTVFGNPKGDIKNPNWAAIDRQMAIIESEFNELKLAVENRQIHDVKGIRDGIADLNVTNLGLAHIIGIESDLDMNAVFYSNMSKLCATPDDVTDSISKYAKIGVEVYVEGNYPEKCIKSAKDQTGTNGEFYKKGKFLKGINFREPDLKEPA